MRRFSGGRPAWNFVKQPHALVSSVVFPAAASPPAAAERPIALWLLACCAMIFLMVVIGGITRLTLSGLSITEWKPVIGIVPPLVAPPTGPPSSRSTRQIPQYRAIHFAMTLGRVQEHLSSGNTCTGYWAG